MNILKKYKYRLNNLDCANCANKIEERLKKENNLSDVVVNFSSLTLSFMSNDDIKIEDITKQYLDYIRHMKELNLEIASEYLVMASELIEMKSKMLLPKKKEKEDDDYEEDPRELLIERLLAYKRYKELPSEFKDLELTRKMVFTREPDNLNRYVKEDENSGVKWFPINEVVKVSSEPWVCDRVYTKIIEKMKRDGIIKK